MVHMISIVATLTLIAGALGLIANTLFSGRAMIVDALFGRHYMGVVDVVARPRRVVDIAPVKRSQSRPHLRAAA